MYIIYILYVHYIYIICILYIYEWSKVIHDKQSAQISKKQDGRNIYAILKRMCPPGYHHNDFVATHALRQMMYGWIHIYIYIYIYIYI